MKSTQTDRLVLASRSPYRRQLLMRLGLEFSCLAADIDETPQAAEPPEDLALRLAREKARAIAEQDREAIVIGSDQVAGIDGQPLGKPGSAERALEQLMAASGRCVTFYTGLCVMRGEKARFSVAINRVHFRPFSEAEARRYIEREQPLDCAGSFKAEALGVTLFERLEGDDPNALIGLPLIRTCEYLRQFGFTLP
ncbi:MAG: Maf family protein [Pseudomonadota bacterium]